MKSGLSRKFIVYLYGHFIGNFLGFIVGITSSRLVSRFFTTRSINNIWGITAHKTVVDKPTFHTMEWITSVLIGFIVFEIVSKWIRKKTEQFLSKSRLTSWLVENNEVK